MNAIFLISALCFALGEIPVDSPEKSSEKVVSDDTVAATVGDMPIYVRDVKRFVENAGRGKKLLPEMKTLLQAQALEELVNRRLVLAYAEREGKSPKPADIDKMLADFKSRLIGEGKSLEEYLKARVMTEEEFRRQLTWSAVWEKYSARYATAERMEKYFASHRREFDGTQVVVSHILLTTDENEEEIAAFVERANVIRREILNGRIDFPDAAKKYSTGLSAADGGKLGPIGRRGPMDESFSRAAFALEVGEISHPVRTHFGVHLIRCDEIRPGEKKLADVEAEVREALERELLVNLAKDQRVRTQVKYAENFPHLPASLSEMGQLPSSAARSGR